MLSQIRKLSSSIFAKIILIIIIIPFVFWGMGPLFGGGSLNTIVRIDKKKIPTQEFINYIEYYAPIDQTLDTNLIGKLLSNFIGEKLISLEIEKFGIKLSNQSLSKIIKNEKTFQKKNKFSRTEYEKFLVEKGLNAVTLESNISKQNKKDQLFDFISGGIIPSKFLVNMLYNSVNQKRNIEIIDLNKFFKQKMNFSESQIESFFNKNKDNYQNVYKSIKFIKLDPKNLTSNDEFSDLFFKKIDKIDNLIASGRNLNFILEKFNLNSANLATFNKFDIDQDVKKINDFPTDLIKYVFNITEEDPTILIEQKDNYFIIELTKTESRQGKITDQSVRKEILSDLKKGTKRKLLSEIITNITNKSFKKNEFDQLSKDENVEIRKIRLDNQDDDKILKKEIVKQVYAFQKNKVAVIADIAMSESYLIYVDKIEQTSVEQNSENYDKYFSLSKAKITSRLYNTYDSYLINKYTINTNYKALNNIKNNFK